MLECVHWGPKCVYVMFVEWVCLLHSKAMPMTLESARCSCNLLNFLDLAVNQNPRGITYDMFDKHSQPEYAGRQEVFIAISLILLSLALSIINFTGA